MTPEQATFLLSVSLPTIQYESEINKKVIQAVPAARSSYRPHEKNWTALELAWHIASSDVWFLDAVANGKFEMEEHSLPAEIKTPVDVVAWYNKNLAAGLEKVKKLSGAQLTKEISLGGVFNLPAVAYLDFLVRHTAHHRGQLSVYLRPMGAKVPSIYGGSADEPMEMSAEA
jgi:uncharacterized damage-inducible protein DinB